MVRVPGPHPISAKRARPPLGSHPPRPITRLQPMSGAMKVPAGVRRRAEAGGEAGRDWLARLPELVGGLAADWGLTLGRTYAGGTAALVVEATTRDGRR